MIFLEESAKGVVLTTSVYYKQLVQPTPRGKQKYLEEGAHLPHSQGAPRGVAPPVFCFRSHLGFQSVVSFGGMLLPN